ncbi:MAG TPA: HNH endonuclease [Corynebacterium casei]|uniref:HNH endonuclease signature motif containing protein n=2 Tax=Corynebacterium casei TaxID=160386 RepID=UPI000ECCCD93|nr:HNH endonuclease signature motif containing protein [Corynebacterium casei]HCJ68948.1 HNH endonuclease [Corynebacterium casei]
MDKYEEFMALTSQAIGILKDMSKRSPYDMASDGMARKTAKSFTTLADVLFGPTDSPRLQRESVALAEDRGLSLEYLEMVEKDAKKLQKRDVRLGRVVDGLRTISITDTQRRITDLEKTLDAAVENDNDRPRSEALLEPFWDLVESTGTGLIRPEYRTVIAIGLDDFAKVSCGKGEDVVVALSDGTTMTGAEFINAAMEGSLGDKLYVGLFHPTAGPVNLYEARFASDKLRTLAMAENLVCPWPDCNVPADRCQVHHIDAHKHGGYTKPSNLTMLCKYHNGVNDDDGPRKKRKRPSPGKPKRGRMRRHRGKVRLHTPGGKLVENTHHVSSMGAMDLI